jgi:hypothetical protein
MIIQGPINELAVALAKAQAEVTHAEKSASNPAFKRPDGKMTTYATLADVWDAIRGPFSKNGLSIVQPVKRSDGAAVVTTMLIHSSGAYISEELEVAGGNNVQQLGSAITYARRYALAAMAGIAPDEDDDGNTAAASHAPRQQQHRQDHGRRAPQSNGREPVAPSERETIEAKPTPGVNNIPELRERAEKLSTKLKGYMKIGLGAMRDEARVSKSGSLSAEELVKFVRWGETTIRAYEDPEPPDDFVNQDAPAWMLTQSEQT